MNKNLGNIKRRNPYFHQQKKGLREKSVWGEGEREMVGEAGGVSGEWTRRVRREIL